MDEAIRQNMVTIKQYDKKNEIHVEIHVEIQWRFLGIYDCNIQCWPWHESPTTLQALLADTFLIQVWRSCYLLRKFEADSLIWSGWKEENVLDVWVHFLFVEKDGHPRFIRLKLSATVFLVHIARPCPARFLSPNLLVTSHSLQFLQGTRGQMIVIQLPYSMNEKLRRPCFALRVVVNVGCWYECWYSTSIKAWTLLRRQSQRNTIAV